MDLQIVVFVTAAVAALASWLWWYRWSQRDFIGPKTWPLVGALPEVRSNLENLHDYATGFLNRIRAIRVSFGAVGYSLYMTVDPETVEYILKTNFLNYPKGPINAANHHEMFGRGIFNVDGEEWSQQRRVAASEFASAKLRDFSTNVFREYALKLASLLQEFQLSQPSRSFNLQDLFMRMTLDSTCRVGFGVHLGSLSPDLAELPFSKAFENTMSASFLRFLDPLWPVKRFFQVGQERVLKQSVSIMDNFTYNVINTRRGETRAAEVSGTAKTERQDLLSRFTKLNMEGKKAQYNDTALRDMILNFIIAGRDTTAVTLSWFYYMLCCHPEVTEKIREEISVLEKNNNKKKTAEEEDMMSRSVEEEMKDFGELLTYENLGTLEYLHAALTESLRLYPAVPIDLKYAMADDNLPDGMEVKKGDLVAFSAYAMGRNKNLWGLDALEFKPERWLRDGSFQAESPFKFTAFQAGPRLCLGKDSAYLQMKLTAALLIRFFDVHIVPDHQVKYRTMVILLMHHGLQVTVRSRHT